MTDPLGARGAFPSASSIGRYKECKASYQMEQLAASWSQTPSDKDDYWAHSGTLIHEAIQFSNPQILNTDDERNNYSKIQHKLNLLLASWNADISDQLIKEERFWMHRDTLIPIFSGQVDYLRIRPDGKEALLVDIKSGWDKPAEPFANTQLLALAVLVWLSYPSIQKITLQIISPHYDFEKYDVGDTTLSLCEKTLRHLIETITVTDRLVPVIGDWCKHCRGLLICPEARKSAGLIKLKDAEFPASLPLGRKAAKILDEIKLLKKFILKVEEHYKLKLDKDPAAIPGWSLVPGDRVRSFRPSKENWQKLTDLFDPDTFLEALTVSITIAEKMLGAKLPEELVTYRQNRPSLEKDKIKKAAPENSAENRVLGNETQQDH